MKKNKLYILASMLVICSFITVMLPSCSKKNTNTTTASSTQAPGGNQQGGGQQPGGGNMSTQIKKEINSLVSKGTITKAQGKKIVTALTSQMGNRNGNVPSGKPSGNSKNFKKPSGTKPSGKSPSGNGFGSSALSKLVKSKVITQKQADAVQKAVFSNMQGGQGGAPSQDNNSSDSSQS